MDSGYGIKSMIELIESVKEARQSPNEKCVGEDHLPVRGVQRNTLHTDEYTVLSQSRHWALLDFDPSWLICRLVAPFDYGKCTMSTWDGHCS